MSKIKVNTIEAQSGSTITVPTGQNLVVTDGLATSSLPTVPVTKGGTGLTSLGTAGQTLQVNSGATALEFATPSSGGIKQVVYATSNTQDNITSTSFTDTSLSATITPSSTSSKILIMFGSNLEAGSGVALMLDIERDIGGTTTLLSGDPEGFVRQQDASQQNHATIVTLDSPSTTSAITYTVQGKNSGSGTSQFCNGGPIATMVLQEFDA